MPSPSKTQPCHWLVAALLFLQVPVVAAAEASNDGLWQDASAQRRASEPAPTRHLPSVYRTLELDVAALEDLLIDAPRSRAELDRSAPTILTLPGPDGGFLRFSVWESPIMEEGLAQKFPEIRTWAGQGIDRPEANLRFDLTPHGFHALVRSSTGAIYIDPMRESDPNSLYMSYHRSEFRRASPDDFQCRVLDTGRAPARASGTRMTAGDTLRTYRLAVAATGEYTAFHGGTTVAGMSAITTAINRVNQIYETEIGVRLVLVANNDQLVYTNAGSDPYSNSDGGAMLGENQTNIDSVIGSANYDVGHVFSTGGGGVAYLAVPCFDSQKAGGVTGSSSPTGDPFWVDYVAHEMGHQFNGPHTFNGTTNACGGGNRSASNAYEPGSGSTIQAYAGICGAENLQSNSDPYFHTSSFDNILSYITDTRPGYGGSCPTTSATGNSAPTVDAGSNYTIPAQTPFTLTGSGSDSQALTYSWEEYDLGTASPPATDDGSRPLFRFWPPTSSPSRTFPRLEDVVDGSLVAGELLPTTTRTMNFRLTARDNQAGGGGVAHDQMSVSVVSSAGPFQVTSQSSNETWSSGNQSVTWNVANTDSSPVNCTSVDIHLSTDGGVTFPTALATATANDGVHTFSTPTGNTTSARVRVLCSGNIFFDINDSDFTIDSSGGGEDPTLTISKAGTGTGTVTSSPAGISCGGDCSESYTSGTLVTLTATPDAGSSFVGWSGGGGCSGTGTCQITLTADVQPVATFDTEGGGGECSGAISLSCNTPVSSTMSGASLNLDGYSCAQFDQPGPEKIYSLEPQASGTVTVDLTGLVNDFDLFVLSDSSGCSASNCLGGSESGGTSSEQVEFSASGGQIYYLVVEDVFDSGGSFTLEATCSGGGGGTDLFSDTFESGDTTKWSLLVD